MKRSGERGESKSRQVLCKYRRAMRFWVGCRMSEPEELRFAVAVRPPIGATMGAPKMNKNYIESTDWLFSVAPMMDWTGVSQKAKLNQQLSIFRK